MTTRFCTCSAPQCDSPSCLDAHIRTARQKVLLHNLRQLINDAAVCSIASRLNGDRRCQIEHNLEVESEYLLNYQARIRFDDGSPLWLMRVPFVTSYTSSPPPLVDYIIQSEYATLMFLAQTRVPAPRVRAYGTWTQNHQVGVPFILTEELPGKKWSRESATAAEKRKVWKSLAKIMVQIEQHPFTQAGSLMVLGEYYRIWPLASDRSRVLMPEGPFPNARAYYTAFVDQHLELIADRQLYTEYPIKAYLVYRFLKDNIAQLIPPDEGSAPEQFFIKHVDDVGDHLLVDADLNITGIINWQMARVVPRREAFGLSLLTASTGNLYGGQVSLGNDDIAFADAMREEGVYACCSQPALVDEKVRRFFWGLAPDLEPTWFYAQPLAQAILKVFGVNTVWEEWQLMALKQYSNDLLLRKLLCRL
ncbi:kinase-like domain [Cordyceps militaris]|uniref:Kinase-like domain n=1 Tax=Cordyceps militaris TaxID=73501 RepID=A0A2H4S9Z0_CORMI|nr:kinase-like domain [Cordyceps militaris]